MTFAKLFEFVLVHSKREKYVESFSLSLQCSSVLKFLSTLLAEKKIQQGSKTLKGSLSLQETFYFVN